MAKGSIEANSDTAITRRGRPRSAETTNAILHSAYTLMASTGLAATSTRCGGAALQRLEDDHLQMVAVA